MSRPGLQAERTSLAWSRTALALLADAGLLLRGRLPTVLTAGALLLAGTAGLLARSRQRALADPGAPDPYAARRVLGLGAAVALLAVAVGACVLLQAG